MALAITKDQLPSIGGGNSVNFNNMKCQSGCAGSNHSSSVKEWGGRAISAVTNKMDVAVRGVISLTQSIFDGLAELTLCTNEVAAVFRKLQKHTFQLAEHLTKTPGYFSKLIGITTKYVVVIDVAQLANDADYLVNKGWKAKISDDGKSYKPADNAVNVCTRISTAVVDIGCALLWFEEMGFYSLKATAAAIGNVRVFSFIPKVVSSIPVIRDVSILQKAAKAVGDLRVFSCINKMSALTITLRALDLMYAFLAIESAQKLIDANKIEDKTERAAKKLSAGLYLSNYISELVLSALLIVGVTNVAALGAMGAVCITLGLSAFFHRVTHEEELRIKPPHMNSPA